MSDSVVYRGKRPVVQRVDAAAAEAFWQRAPLATPFMFPTILEALCATVDWWLARVDDEPVCLWPVCRRVDGRIDAPEFSYYVGPLFRSPHGKPSVRANLMQRAAVIAAIADELLARYGGFSIELPPGELDLRPYLWWARERGVHHELTIRPQYTACLSLEHDPLPGFAAKDRRPAVRKWRHSHLTPLDAWHDDDVQRLYAAMSQRQRSPELHARRAEEIRRLCELIRAGFGIVTAVASTPGRPIDALSLVLTQGHRACSVLSLADDAARRAAILPWLTYLAMTRCRALDIQSYDFNGANSPERGSDVHSYGADVCLYFAIDYWTGTNTGQLLP